MTLPITVPPSTGEPTETYLADVAAGASRLLGDLGLPSAVDVHVGDQLAVAGVPIPVMPGDRPFGLADDAQRAIADLATRRGALVLAASDLPAGSTEWLVASFRAAFASGDRSERTPGESAEDHLARSLHATDARPLRITIAPDDAEGLTGDLVSLDLELRQTLYDNLCLALPPVLGVDDATTPGTITAQVRDVRYPSYALDGDVDDLLQLSTPYWAAIAVGNVPALVTPASMDAALVLTNVRGPESAKLAERRWTRSALADLLRYQLLDVDTGPADLPLLVEALATMELPEPNPDDDLALTLARELPGLAASFLAGDPNGERGIDRLRAIVHAARAS